eukprot:COSAG01_NODE_8058_length_2937_cov_1.595490_1_plen_285_part_00
MEARGGSPTRGSMYSTSEGQADQSSSGVEPAPAPLTEVVRGDSPKRSDSSPEPPDALIGASEGGPLQTRVAAATEAVAMAVVAAASAAAAAVATEASAGEEAGTEATTEAEAAAGSAAAAGRPAASRWRWCAASPPPRPPPSDDDHNASAPPSPSSSRLSASSFIGADEIARQVRSTLTDIHLCRACSCDEIDDGHARQAGAHRDALGQLAAAQAQHRQAFSEESAQLLATMHEAMRGQATAELASQRAAAQHAQALEETAARQRSMQVGARVPFDHGKNRISD